MVRIGKVRCKVVDEDLCCSVLIGVFTVVEEVGHSGYYLQYESCVTPAAICDGCGRNCDGLNSRVRGYICLVILGNENKE